MHPRPRRQIPPTPIRPDLRLAREARGRHDPAHVLIAEFVAHADVGDATRCKYRAHLDEFARWLTHPGVRGEGAELLDVEPIDVQRFLAYLTGERFAARQQPRATTPMGPSARKSALGSLRAFYRYLVLMRVAANDPTLHIKAPRVRHHPGIVLTAPELRTLLDEQGSARERIQTYLLAYSAARSDEIRSLRWSDVDLRAATMLLNGKGERYRVIDIHPVLMGELRRWLIVQLDEASANAALAAAKADTDTDFVLLWRSGRQLAKTTIGRQLKRRAVRAGIRLVEQQDGMITSRVSPHAMRRTFATILLNNGEPLDSVADVLGHRFTDSTRTHYAFASNERRRAAIYSFRV